MLFITTTLTSLIYHSHTIYIWSIFFLRLSNKFVLIRIYTCICVNHKIIKIWTGKLQHIFFCLAANFSIRRRPVFANIQVILILSEILFIRLNTLKPLLNCYFCTCICSSIRFMLANLCNSIAKHKIRSIKIILSLQVMPS